MPEIDEVELIRLRKQDQTVQTLWGNPKARRKIQEAIKDADPNARFPELELEEAARAPVQALETRFSELEKKIGDDAAEREKNAKLTALTNQVEAGKAKLRKDGWTDDGIAAVEKVMEERGIVDVEIAAAYYEKLHPPQAPITPRTGGWDFAQPDQSNEYEKALTANKNAAENDHLVMSEAMKVLNDIRGARR